ncbi:MAG: Bax inhibitor-1/YccA family protein [Pseudomonadota bacterium]
MRSGQTNPAAGVGGLSADVSNVLRNTYMLLAMTLGFASLVAYVAMSLHLPHPGFILTLAGFFGLLFLVEKTADSAMGLVSIFLFTGFLGYTLGPILDAYLQYRGSGVVVSALGTASFAFVGLSAFALITRKDFSFLSGFLTVGIFVLMGAVVFAWLFELSGWHTAISAGFVLFSSAAILYQTGAIVNGGERNYIRATTTLFVSFYNLFVSLLQIFGVMGDD